MRCAVFFLGLNLLWIQRAPAAEVVLLGQAELTSGVPGEGPLTREQVERWLAQPRNHVELQVELPVGLAQGQDALVIPEDNPLTRAKIELGRQLYFDRRLSQDATVSCADCHHPDYGYAKDTQFGVGIRGQTGNRNSPVAYNRILSQAQFWDGRAESLEAQAVGPIANPIEMGHTHEAVVALVNKNSVYRVQFEKIFGQTATIEDIGKALASFERASSPAPAHMTCTSRWPKWRSLSKPSSTTWTSSSSSNRKCTSDMSR